MHFNLLYKQRYRCPLIASMHSDWHASRSHLDPILPKLMVFDHRSKSEEESLWHRTRDHEQLVGSPPGTAQQSLQCLKFPSCTSAPVLLEGHLLGLFPDVLEQHRAEVALPKGGQDCHNQLALVLWLLPLLDGCKRCSTTGRSQQGDPPQSPCALAIATASSLLICPAGGRRCQAEDLTFMHDLERPAILPCTSLSLQKFVADDLPCTQMSINHATE